MPNCVKAHCPLQESAVPKCRLVALPRSLHRCSDSGRYRRVNCRRFQAARPARFDPNLVCRPEVAGVMIVLQVMSGRRLEYTDCDCCQLAWMDFGAVTSILQAPRSVPADRLLSITDNALGNKDMFGLYWAIWTGGALGNMDISIERH
jgi:hypothetical protein